MLKISLGPVTYLALGILLGISLSSHHDPVSRRVLSSDTADPVVALKTPPADAVPDSTSPVGSTYNGEPPLSADYTTPEALNIIEEWISWPTAVLFAGFMSITSECRIMVWSTISLSPRPDSELFAYACACVMLVLPSSKHPQIV